MSFSIKIIACLLSVVVLSCSSRLDKCLNRAELYMSDNHSESLRILDSLKNNNMSQKEAARFALLYSQAKDKNWIDETDDSLINVAVNYFEHSSDSYYKFLSFYYLGRVNQNAGNLSKAIVAFTKAEDLVGEVHDNYSIGLLYANLGILFQKIYDYPKSLEAFNSAYDYYMLSGKNDHAMYARYNIGNVLMNTKQFDRAETLLREVLEWAEMNSDKNTYSKCVRLLASIYEDTGNTKGLKDLLLNEGVTVTGNLKMLQYYAYLVALGGDFRKSEDYMQKSWMKARTSKDSAFLYYREYTIDKLKGDFEEALKNHERYFYIQDTTVRAELQQPIISAQKDFYKNEARYNTLLVKLNREKLLIISIASIIVFVLMTVLHIFRIKVKQKRIDGYMDKIQNLEFTLLSAINENDVAKVKMNEKVSELFTNQFKLIDKLSTTYYETHGSSKDKDAIYKQVTNEIEKLSSSKKHLALLEEIVDTYLDNVMQKTRGAVPQLSEMDFRILCYIYAGFSAKAISIFTNNSTGNIYMKKKRLKEKISSSNSPNVKDILMYLN